MSAEDKPSRSGTAAIVIATASVTLAIGVTVAALGGYLEPRGGSQRRSARLSRHRQGQADTPNDDGAFSGTVPTRWPRKLTSSPMLTGLVK